MCAAIVLTIAFVVLGQIFITNFWIGSAFLALRFLIALAAAAASLIATKTKSILVRRFLIVLLSIAVGSMVADKILQPQPDSIAASAHTRDFRVTTYNLLLNNHRTKKTIDILTRKKAHVLLLQEVTPRHQRDLGPKGSRANELIDLTADPSRMAALLNSSFVSTKSSFAPCPPNASTPRSTNSFTSEP